MPHGREVRRLALDQYVPCMPHAGQLQVQAEISAGLYGQIGQAGSARQSVPWVAESQVMMHIDTLTD